LEELKDHTAGDASRPSFLFSFIVPGRVSFSPFLAPKWFWMCRPNMNKTEIAETLRKEVGELEVSINKLQARCERLKTFVLDLEAEIAGPEPVKPGILEDSRFRKAIDSVFGEKPKRPKR
jgi:hypothetical protein